MEKIVKIDDDLKRNEELYKIFDEESRLKSRTGLVEKITTQREIDKLINANSKVLVSEPVLEFIQFSLLAKLMKLLPLSHLEQTLRT